MQHAFTLLVAVLLAGTRAPPGARPGPATRRARPAPAAGRRSRAARGDEP